MERIVSTRWSVIPSCDCEIEVYKRVLKETHDLECVGAYKVGFFLGCGEGLRRVLDITREHTDKRIIYDPQKGGTDNPYMGRKFANVVKRSGIDTIILFPFSGPEVEQRWIEAAFAEGLNVMVGGLMTHPKFLRSEGGYIADEAVVEIYLNAARLGVRDFVVPGTKLRATRTIKELIDREVENAVFYGVGFGKQGGRISDAAKVLGRSWHAIVGEEIYGADDIRKTTLGLARQIE